MAISYQIIFLTTVILFLHENAQCKKDFQSFFLRRNTHLRRSWHEQNRQRRTASTPTAKEKETNKLVLAALYGGLGQGIPSAKNLDYANGLNTKIQSVGGYGLPSGIYSYAFDPSTGMPFMCDPTKTPPGGSKSQAAGAAAINPPAASKPTADEPSDVPSENVPSDNVPSDNVPSDNVPSENVPSKIGDSTSAPSPDPSSTNANEVITAESPPGTNTVGTNGDPEHRLSPIEHTPPAQKAQNDVSSLSDANPTSLPGNEETTPTSGNDDDLMTSSSPSNKVHDGVTPTPNKGKTTSSVSDKMTSSEHPLEKPSTITPAPQSNGNQVENHISNDVSNDVSNHVKPSGVTSSPKGIQVKLGPPLYVENPKTIPQSSTQSKATDQRLTPLIDNYHKELKLGGRVKQSNSLKKYLQSKTMVKKNDITIKLPEIPACPDMKNYHWPWNCLDKGKTVKKECIQNYQGTFSYNGATFPYEDYGHLYDYNADEIGNY